MRIVWNDEAARRAADLLETTRAQVKAAIDRSHTVSEAIAEADPAGDNKRLSAIAEDFGKLLSRLRKAEEDIERCHAGTRFMIETFEDVERQSVDVMEGLETGVAADVLEDGAAAAEGGTAPDTGLGETVSPVIGPHLNIGPMALMPEWLEESMAENYFRGQ